MSASASETSTPRYHNDPLLTAHDVASWLGVRVETVYQWHSQHGGPRSVRLGKRAIRFRRSDVEAWLEGQRP
jgi:excisionase family DNA binding protein